jgi:hypothetical protein
LSVQTVQAHLLKTQEHALPLSSLSSSARLKTQRFKQQKCTSYAIPLCNSVVEWNVCITVQRTPVFVIHSRKFKCSKRKTQVIWKNVFEELNKVHVHCIWNR